MSILRDALPGARVLDLFAGSGALGLEALSRGAASADFVELEPAVARGAAGATSTPLGVGERATVHRGDALRFARRARRRRLRRRLRRPALQRTMPPPGWSRSSARTPFARILSVEHRGRPAARGRRHPSLRRHRPHLLPRPMTRIAIYPARSIRRRRGHEDLIRRSLALADRVIVAVAVNAAKQPLFRVEERLGHAARRRSAPTPRVSLRVVRRAAGRVRPAGGRVRSSSAGSAR